MWPVWGICNNTAQSAIWLSLLWPATGAVWFTSSFRPTRYTLSKKTSFPILYPRRVLMWVPAELTVLFRLFHGWSHFVCCIREIMCRLVVSNAVINKNLIGKSVLHSLSRRFLYYFLYRSCAILADEFVFIIIVLRRFSSRCFRTRTSILLFPLFPDASGRLMLVDDEATFVRGNLIGILSVAQFIWSL